MLVECVPNFSEGRDPAVVDRIRASISAYVPVLDVNSDRDHNRSVITFAGPPAAVEHAVIDAARAAVEFIDLRRHRGVHPRIGAVDVIPFVPVSGVALEDCAAMAKRVAAALWQQLGLPSFYYEAAGEDRGLQDVRRAANGGAAPDVGAGRHPTAGAVAIGARRFLVAWNILLDTRDLSLAKQIARTIRQSNGGFPGVKALGLPLEERGCVQVSINSTDFEATPLQAVLEAVEQQARRAGVKVQGSELIGLIPERALDGTNLRWINFEPRMVLETNLKSLPTIE